MIEGTHIIGYRRVKSNAGFQALNPATGKHLPEYFSIGSSQNVQESVQLAAKAFSGYGRIPGKEKAGFLRAIAEEILLLGDELITRAVSETGLPAARIQGERTRTVSQLMLFAELLEEGSWVEATLDSALPDRIPAPRPAICRMLLPLGPVVVFGASNFPLAFSVAGGDTVSALAAGNPVIVKAHPSHPGTSELVGAAISRAARKTSMPEGVFSLLFDEGFEVGEALVAHPGIRAVAFTGSFRGGMSLLQIAQKRKDPIPVFAEMGSINPVILLPEALEKNTESLAKQCAASVTLGAGQYCTNPGLLLALESDSLDRFISAYGQAIKGIIPGTMLNAAIANNYRKTLGEMLDQPGVELIAQAEPQNGLIQNIGKAIIARVKGADFLDNPGLHHEVFGPFSLLVSCKDFSELEKIIEGLEGQLTISLMTETGELSRYPKIVEMIRRKAGRLICNGLPTGVEVCAAMQHGGPFPATTDSRFTSVGTYAIKRFARAVTFQNWEDDQLPDELKAANPLGIRRLVDNAWTI